MSSDFDARTMHSIVSKHIPDVCLHSELHYWVL